MAEPQPETTRLYIESTPTNCIIDGEHGQVTEIVRDLAPRRTPRAAFVHLEMGDILYVTLGAARGDRDQFREVKAVRRIDRDEFDRLNEIDTLRPAMPDQAESAGLRVLVACEYSGAVRDAFRALGHDAMSCDLLPTDVPGPHHQGDVRDVLDDGWDLMVAHPPCTYLTNAANGSLYRTTPSPSGALTGPDRWKALIDGATFFRSLLHTQIPRVAVENPVMNGYAQSIIGRGPDQVIQPWMFGHTERKGTGLWLRGLPPLLPTKDVYTETMVLPVRERDRVHYAPPSADRWKVRSTTYAGIAKAMAEQWGGRVPAMTTLSTGGDDRG